MSHVKLSSLRWMGGAMLTLALFLGPVPLQAVEEEQAQEAKKAVEEIARQTVKIAIEILTNAVLGISPTAGDGGGDDNAETTALIPGGFRTRIQ